MAQQLQTIETEGLGELTLLVDGLVEHAMTLDERAKRRRGAAPGSSKVDPDNSGGLQIKQPPAASIEACAAFITQKGAVQQIPGRCTVCKNGNHPPSECPIPNAQRWFNKGKTDRKPRDGPRGESTMKCYRCKVVGHIKANCPVAPTARKQLPKPPSDGR